MSITTIFCDECHEDVEAKEIKAEHDPFRSDYMLTTSIGMGCGHKILSTRQSRQEEAKKWSDTKKITLSLTEMQDLQALKGKDERANEFVYNLMKYVTSNKTRFRDWNEWKKAHNCYYPPSDYSEDEISGS